MTERTLSEAQIRLMQASRTMLAALHEARDELAQFEVRLRNVDTAIAQAEAAGITAED
jgi:uncharacterized protein YukE